MEQAHPAPNLSSLKETKQLAIRCPYCKRDATYDLPNLAGDYAFSCPMCKNAFKAKVMVVRAKAGQQDKKQRQRELRLRGAYPDGREDHLVFVKAGIEDIEARSGDMIAISYRLKGGVAALPVVINNYNIGRTWFISAPGGCGGAAALLLVALASSGVLYLSS